MAIMTATMMTTTTRMIRNPPTPTPTPMPMSLLVLSTTAAVEGGTGGDLEEVVGGEVVVGGTVVGGRATYKIIIARY